MHVCVRAYAYICMHCTLTAFLGHVANAQGKVVQQFLSLPVYTLAPAYVCMHVLTHCKHFFHIAQRHVS